MLLNSALRDAARGSNAEKSYELSVERYSDALRCINRRLANPDLGVATAADVIRTVLGTICYDVSKYNNGRL